MFRTVRTGNYAQSAQAVTKASDQIFAASMDAKPDFTKIAKEAIKGRSLERRAAAKAEGAVAKAGINAFADVTNYKMKADAMVKEGERKGKKARMAGVVGALGGIATGFTLKADKKAEAAERAARDAREAKRDAQWEELLDRPVPKFEFDEARPEDPNANPAIPARPGESAGAGSSDPGNSAPAQIQPQVAPSSKALKTGSTLTGVGKTLSDAIAKYESGSYGYEAFNQGGAAGGTKVLGKSGNHKNHFGRSLTDMTLSEIFHRQNTAQRGLSMQQHLDSGGLHAVGRYQFIGSTLQDEVRRMGLDPKTTKFTPEVQDQIFLSHIKRVGSISPWVGPMQYYSDAEKRGFNNMIQQL